MRSKEIILPAIALLFCFLSQAGVQAQEEKPFKIGVAVSLTGGFGRDGMLVNNAYTLWMEKVNASGGINEHKVEIIFYDDKSDATTAAKLTEQLIESDKVDLLLGGFGSDAVFAASAVAEQRGYPLISGGASSNKLFERGFKFLFSTLGKATEEVRCCVDFIQAVQPRPKTAAIVGPDIPVASLACEGYKKYCAENNIEVIHFELFPMALEDFNSLFLKIKTRNPDVLLVGSDLPVATKTMKALKEIDFSPKAVAFSCGPTVPKFITQLKDDAEYVMAASEWTPNMPHTGALFWSARDFNNAYFERFKRYPDYVEAASAAGALVQQMVIEKLGLKPPLSRKDRNSIMEKLHAGIFDTFYGKIQFGPDGANIAHPPLLVQVQNGKLMNVFPLEFAESKIWYPFKPWKER